MKKDTNFTSSQDDSQKIWDEIKNITINIYAIPNQKVKDHVTVLEVPGSELYLKLKSTAVLPALEECVGNKYEVELAEKYTIVRRAAANAALNKALSKA